MKNLQFQFILFCASLLWSEIAVAEEPTALTATVNLEKSLINAIAIAEKSVVSIARIHLESSNREESELNPFGINLSDLDSKRSNQDPNSPDFIPNDFGTGIIISHPLEPDQRLILTNYHVVYGGVVEGEKAKKQKIKLYVRLPNRAGYEAKIIAADPHSDLAILSIDYEQLGLTSKDLPAISFSTNDKYQKGQLVIALGNPYAIARDGSASASWGMISNISRRPHPSSSSANLEKKQNSTIHHYGTLLQVDTRLNLGTSGGALINFEGKLVGLTTSMAALSGYETSAGYAIPVNQATQRIIRSLAQGFEPEYGFLGLRPKDVLPKKMKTFTGKFNQLTAALSIEVFPNSPAEQGGVKNGDLILAVNKVTVKSRYDLIREIEALGPNAEAKLKIWRESSQQELILAVNLGKWPVQNDQRIIASRKRYSNWRGLDIDYPTGRERFLSFPIRIHKAVLVTNVIPKSAAEQSGIQTGDFITHVNETAVQTPAEFHAALKKSPGDVNIKRYDRSPITIHK